MNDLDRTERKQYGTGERKIPDFKFQRKYSDSKLQTGILESRNWK
jgi:hypothetical protein